MAQRRKQKVYAVRRGRQPGLYATWAECQRQVTGYRGAEFKSFPSRMEAQWWMDGAPESPASAAADASGAGRAAGTASGRDAGRSHDRPRSGIAVDGACSGNPGPMEYRGVDLATGETLFSDGPYGGGTNNLAEFLAIVDAARMIAADRHPGPVWSDSRTAMVWIDKGKANTRVDPRTMDPALAELVAAAERWLAARDPGSAPLPVRKWETDAWGEIPADFGRKG